MGRWRVGTTPRRDLRTGEVLDGEGGTMVWGKCVPAAWSLAEGALPIGLAHGVRVTRAVAKGSTVGWADVAVDEGAEAVKVRWAMEAGTREAVGLGRAAE